MKRRSMKNVFLTGTAALALVFGLVLAGCPEAPPLTDNPFNTPETVLVEEVNIGPDDDWTSAWGNVVSAVTNVWGNAVRVVTNRSRYMILDLGRCKFTNDTVTGSSNGGKGMNIFRDNSYIIGIILPASVTSIGQYAFKGCYNLTSVSIPANVTSIGQYAFSGCYNLTSVSIPAGVTSIGEAAFSYCSGLTSVSMPAGVTSIGQQAFYGCTGLTSVSIPANVTSIGERAFYGCTGLTSVTIPANVTSIGNYAFYCCSGLTSVTFETGSDIDDAYFGNKAFPEGEYGNGGNSLRTAYLRGGAGTYTRPANGTTWDIAGSVAAGARKQPTPLRGRTAFWETKGGGNTAAANLCILGG
jgi:hypothetical protein